MLLDCGGDVPAHFGGFAVVDLFGIGDHADFPSRLHREGLLHAGEPIGEGFQLFEAADEFE